MISRLDFTATSLQEIFTIMQVPVNTHITAIASLSSSINLQAVEIFNITSINVNRTNTINSHITAIGNLTTQSTLHTSNIQALYSTSSYLEESIDTLNAAVMFKPWIACRVDVSGDVVLSYGQQIATRSGSSTTRREIVWTTPHPNGANAIVLVSVYHMSGVLTHTMKATIDSSTRCSVWAYEAGSSTATAFCPPHLVIFWPDAQGVVNVSLICVSNLMKKAPRL